MAEPIVEQGADCVLALKDNHPWLHEDMRLWLDTQSAGGTALSPLETLEKDYGRREIRCYFYAQSGRLG
jgi:hypothetical protein